MTEEDTMVREVMTDAQLAYAESIAAKNATKKSPARRPTMVRYQRPTNADLAAARVADDAGLPLTSIDRAALGRSQSDAVDRLTRPGGPGAAPLFVATRPRADRLVYVLLRELSDLDMDAGHAGTEWYERNRLQLTVEQGSDWINRLRAKIARSPGNAPEPASMPETVDRNQAVWDEWHRMAGELAGLGGRYGARFAVDTEPGATNTIAFWWISPTKTPGRFFLRQIIGGSGPVRVRMTPQAMIAIAKKINAAGPDEALRRYGRELGECGHCGRHLTNDESRALGIGPWCRNHN